MNKRIYSSLLILALMGVCSMPSYAGPKPKHTVTIKAGATGDDVKYIQAFLVSKGWDMKDATFGTFDEATQKKLAEVIPAAKNRDGSVSAGSGTWTKIEKAMPESQVKTKITEIETKISNDKTAEIDKKKKEEEDDKRSYSLSASDLLDLGFTFDFGNSGLQVKGSIPEECKKRLKISSSISESVSAEDVDSDEAQSLSDRSSKVRISATFEGSDKLHDELTSLKKCIDKYKSDSKVAKTDLNHSVSFDGSANLGILQFLEDGTWKDASPKVVSPRYSKLERLAKDTDCKACNTLKKTKSKIEELTNLDEASMSSVTKSLIEKAVSQISDSIDSATSISELERARADLVSLARSAHELEDDRAELMEQIGKELDHLLTRNQDLAKTSHADCGKKSKSRSFYESGSCVSESKFADFASKTYKEIAGLPGLSKDKKDEYRALSKDYAAGGLERVRFIASVNPVNEEVTDALGNSQADLRALSVEVRRECAFMSPQTFNSCNRAKQDYLDLSKTYQDLYQQYTSASGVPQYGMQSPFGVTSYMNPGQFGPGMSAGLPQAGQFGPNGQNGMFRPMNAPYMNGMFPQGQFPQNQNMVFGNPQMNGMQQFNSPLNSPQMQNGGQVFAIPVTGGMNTMNQGQFRTI
jgi:hypothetical protein